MLKLDNNLLDELGLGGLPDDQKQAMLQHIYDTLELRVGTNLANQMTDRQLQEFEQFIDESGEANQAQALQWLEANLPNYKQVVNEVFEALKAEIRQMAPQIMASSGMPQQPVAAPASFQSPLAQPMPPSSQVQPAAPSAADPYQYQPPMSSAAGLAPMQPVQTQQSPQFSPVPDPGYQAPSPSLPLPPQPQPATPGPMGPVSQFAADPAGAPPQFGSVPQSSAQPQQAAQPYQFLAQQPPAGPGGQPV